MKKVFLAMIFAGMMAVSAQAQYFAGGTLGFDYSTGKSVWGTSTNKNPSNLSFEFSPMMGIYLDDNLGVGMRVILRMENENNRADDPTKYKKLEWGGGFFMRYTTLTRGDFSILIEGGAGVFGGSSKTVQGTSTNKGPKTFGFNVGVMPILSYSLTSSINLEASSNLARFGFEMQTKKSGSGDSQQKGTDSSFGFGIDSDHFFSSPYRIGMIFKF
jgi:hypothetical protein